MDIHSYCYWHRKAQRHSMEELTQNGKTLVWLNFGPSIVQNSYPISGPRLERNLCLQIPIHLHNFRFTFIYPLTLLNNGLLGGEWGSALSCAEFTKCVKLSHCLTVQSSKGTSLPGGPWFEPPKSHLKIFYACLPCLPVINISLFKEIPLSPILGVGKFPVDKIDHAPSLTLNSVVSRVVK